MPPGKYGGVTVWRPGWSVVITADVSGNPSREKAFKAFLGACRHRR
jgi:hypothetical protein